MAAGQLTMPGLIDFFHTHPHYRDHLLPLWEAMPADRRGRWYTEKDRVPDGGQLTVVASFGNTKKMRGRGRPVVLVNHGVGMRYRDVENNAYAGGADRDGVVLNIVPNRWAEQAERDRHPELPVAVVGCPKLDPLWARPPKPQLSRPLVVVSFHWWGWGEAPESRWAWPHFQRQLPQLLRWCKTNGIRLAGHAHPVAQRELLPRMQSMGMPVYRHFGQVLDEADVYVADTTSTLYEFAATDRPVLVLNAPWYRRDVHHGIRFWEVIPGLQVDGPEQLLAGVAAAMEDAPELQAARRAAVAAVYPVRDGTSAARAVAAILEVADSLQ